LPELALHLFAGVVVTGDVAHGQVYAFFDDQLIAADVRQYQFVFFLLGSHGTFVFAADGIEQDVVRLLRKGQETQLRIIKEPVDKMELDQHPLAQKLSAVEKDLMVLEIIDVLDLEGRHADLPDDFAGRGTELDILGRDQGICGVGGIVLLSQLLMRKIEIILVNKTSVKTFSFLVKGAIPIVWQDLVRKGLIHSQVGFGLMDLDFSPHWGFTELSTTGK
jgi:hypothetical protein